MKYQVNLKLGCATYWELDDNPDYRWLRIAEVWIQYQSLAFFMAATLIYVLASQLLIIFYEKVTLDLEKLTILGCNRQQSQLTTYNSTYNKLDLLLNTFFHIQRATLHLQNTFAPILTLNLCYIFIAFVKFMFTGLIVGDSVLILWQLIFLADISFRFWLITHFADRVHHSVSNDGNLIV